MRGDNTKGAFYILTMRGDKTKGVILSVHVNGDKFKYIVNSFVHMESDCVFKHGLFFFMNNIS